jgi:hypothetical protein
MAKHRRHFQSYIKNSGFPCKYGQIWINIDKYGHRRVIMSSVSGERLKIARNIKNYGLKELADVFHITLNALQKWQTRGISDRGIDVVAHHFHVQKWVFRDETLSEEQFVEIINNPDLMKKYLGVGH